MLRFVFYVVIFLFISFSADADVDNHWYKLLHYQKKGNVYVSLVESSEYFLDKNGRFDPKKEYEKHIDEFNKKDDELRCRFPARFIYLKRKGKVSGDLSRCEEYNQYLDDLQAKSVTMLFTNAYMSNPSSLFGHTLFRIDTLRTEAQLLAHGANFGADTGEDSGVLYALRGLYGGYYGTFSIKPYYDVINLYNNIENRDIWEYELDLTEDELELFIALMWELKEAKVRYYFFTKNCSYLLLSMLEATKSDLELVKKFKLNAIPLSTLKEVDKIGLIKNTNYRPSRMSKLKNRYIQMNSKQKEVLVDIIKNDMIKLEELKDNEKADVLETAYQYIQYQYVERKLELKEYRKKSFVLLTQRSKIKDNTLYFDDLEVGENPIKSHGQNGIGVVFGARNGSAFQEISYKPAYTSLMESSYGLLKGAEINLLETKIRHYDSKNKYVLDELNVMSIKSINGKDVMFNPFSYDIGFGLKEKFNPKTGEDTLAFELEGGVGEAYNISHNLAVYVMSVPSMVYGGGMEENGYLSFGFRGGIYYNNEDFRLNGSAEKIWTTENIYSGEKYLLEGGYSFTKNLNLYAGYKFFNTKYNDDEEIMFGVKVNF
ncbi:MAG: DUF4105 domain-containing protein [Alphaproteobacteria bacterium]|nr:DUF4105 domain-containing protein [Alphaproteobacteria bacterium]